MLLARPEDPQSEVTDGHGARWRCGVAVRACSGAKVAGAATSARDRASPLRGGHGAHEKRKGGRRSRAGNGGVHGGRAPVSDSVKENARLGLTSGRFARRAGQQRGAQDGGACGARRW